MPKYLHWTDTGRTNWFEIAKAVGEISTSLKIIEKAANVDPISTSQYPSKVIRPMFSVLNCDKTRDLIKYKGKDWYSSLFEMLETHKDELHSLI